MRKILTQLKQNERGFSLVETLIAVGVSVTVLMIASSEVRRSLELKKLVQNNDVVTDIESNIRRAVKDPVSLERSGNRSSSLGNCLSKDDDICTVTFRRQNKQSGSKIAGEPFDLYFISGTDAGEMEKKLTGSYDGSGGSCVAGCPLTVETTFYGVCAADAPQCDLVETLVVNYAISMEGKSFRSGVVTITYNQTSTNDDNLPCGVDANNNPKFARSVSGGAATCVELTPAQRRLTGVNPGGCVMGKEVLVGFDPGTKNAICVTAKFKAPAP